MKRAATALDQDLASPVIESFRVAVIELDYGPLYLTDGRHLRMGGQELRPAVTSWGTLEHGQATLTLRAEALPRRATWWINRRCRVYRVTLDQARVEGGRLLLDGVIEQQPAETGGELSLPVSRPLFLQPQMVPGLGLIDAACYPRASDQAMGKVKPLVFGTVESCPLLPVEVQPTTTLTSAATPGDRQIEVADASALAEAGAISLDGEVYAYAGRTDTLLLGLTVRRRHPAGTAVAQAGRWTYLAAGHPLAGLTALKGDDTLLADATLDLSAATVSFAGPPLIREAAEARNRVVQFDQLNPSSTARDGVQAIRAATGAFHQTATTLPVVTDGSGSILFPRPETDRIIVGLYRVAFSVTGAGSGQVTIAGTVVWAAVDGEVIYNEGEAVWESDADSDDITVTASAGVTVTILGASRGGFVGNIDDTGWAALSWPDHRLLSVRQTTDTPDLGDIVGAAVEIEWFAADELPPGCGAVVRWGGREIGRLTQKTLEAQITTNHIAIDIDSQGYSYLRKGTGSAPDGSNIRAVISGSTTTTPGYSQTIPNQTSIYYPTYSTSASNYSRNSGDFPGFTPERFAALLLVPPGGVSQSKTHTVRVYYSARTMTKYSGSGALVTAPAWLFDSQDPDAAPRRRSVGLSGSAGGMASSGLVLSGGTGVAVFSHTCFYSGDVTVTRVEVDWGFDDVYHPPVTASVNGDVFVDNPYLYNQGITLGLRLNGLPVASAQGGEIVTRVPAPARASRLSFPLPIRAWSAFTGQDLEIEYQGSATTPTIAIIKACLIVDYNAVKYRVPERLTATVTGRSGNPAEIARALAEAAGDRVAAAPYRRARDWYARQGWSFARVIAGQTAARDLMYALCDEALLGYHETDDGLALIRRLDLGTPITDIAERDLMAPAQWSWTALTELANDLTLRYRRIEGETTRVLVRTAASPDRWAVRGEAEAGGRLSAEIASDWIADEATAGSVLKARLRLSAPLRRSVALTLSPAFSRLESGDLIRYGGVLCRADQPRFDGARLSLTATEIPV